MSPLPLAEAATSLLPARSQLRPPPQCRLPALEAGLLLGRGGESRVLHGELSEVCRAGHNKDAASNRPRGTSGRCTASVVSLQGRMQSKCLRPPEHQRTSCQLYDSAQLLILQLQCRLQSSQTEEQLSRYSRSAARSKGAPQIPSEHAFAQAAVVLTCFDAHIAAPRSCLDEQHAAQRCMVRLNGM